MLLILHSVLWAAMHLTPFMHFHASVHERFTLIETEDVPRRHRHNEMGVGLRSH